MKIALGLLLAAALTFSLHGLARVAPEPPPGAGTAPVDASEPPLSSISEADGESGVSARFTF